MADAARVYDRICLAPNSTLNSEYFSDNGDADYLGAIWVPRKLHKVKHRIK